MSSKSRQKGRRVNGAARLEARLPPAHHRDHRCPESNHFTLIVDPVTLAAMKEIL